MSELVFSVNFELLGRGRWLRISQSILMQLLRLLAFCFLVLVHGVCSVQCGKFVQSCGY